MRLVNTRDEKRKGRGEEGLRKGRGAEREKERRGGGRGGERREETLHSSLPDND